QETEERPMANHLPVVELTDAELEMVSAGQYIAASNLVNVQLNNVLNNKKIAVDVVALNNGAFTQIQKVPAAHRPSSITPREGPVNGCVNKRPIVRPPIVRQPIG